MFNMMLRARAWCARSAPRSRRDATPSNVNGVYRAIIVSLAVFVFECPTLAHAAIDGWKHGALCYVDHATLSNDWASQLGRVTENGSVTVKDSPVIVGSATVGNPLSYSVVATFTAYAGTAAAGDQTLYGTFLPCDSGVHRFGDTSALIWIGLGVLVAGIGFVAGRLR